MFRGRAAYVVLALLLVWAVPGPAHAGPSGTSFEAETEGSPVATELGSWTESEGGRHVKLEFEGGHVIGAGTTFVARWLTPVTPEDEAPYFESSYEFENMNLIGDKISLTESFRSRDRGGKWSKWAHIRFRTPGQSWTSGFSGMLFQGFGSRGMQFEWRLEGAIEAPTVLRGSAELTIN